MTGNDSEFDSDSTVDPDSTAPTETTDHPDTNSQSEDSTGDPVPTPDVPKLDDQQSTIVDEFCDPSVDSGLFVLSSHPGAGKSTASGKAAATQLYRHYLAGDHTPERRLLATSFSKEDAADIVPDIVDWLWALYHRDEIPTNETVSADEIRNIERRLRQGASIGTVDGVLRSVFDSIATDVGFDGMPTVGNKALLTRLRIDCYEELGDDPEYGPLVDQLEVAYPDSNAQEVSEYVSSLREMLEEALLACRERNLSIEEFQTNLYATVNNVYAEQEAGSPAAIRDAVEQACGPDAAAEVDSLETDEMTALTDADEQLHNEWLAAIDKFCELLGAYRERYDDLTHQRGVIAHVDCAYWVAEYFTADDDHDLDVDDDRRERVRERFQDQIESVIVDEAQDVSEIQYTALAELVASDMKLFLAGDLKQSIYVWRNAHPKRFQQAIRDGVYFGINWDHHVYEKARQNYRSRPDIVAAINAIAEETLPEPDRGNLGELDITFSPLQARRSSTERTNVHVAQFRRRENEYPGTEDWVTGEGNEAQAVARVLAGGVEDGTFVTTDDTNAKQDTDADALISDSTDEIDDEETTDAEKASPPITVLFPRTKYMGAYEQALESRGFSVGNERIPLFETTAVRMAVAVLEWLIDPFDPERTKRLVTTSPLSDGDEGLRAASSAFQRHGWAIEDVARALGSAASDGGDELEHETGSGIETEPETRTTEGGTEPLPEGTVRVLEGLDALATDLPRRRADPVAVVARDVIDALGLEADPLDCDMATTRAQRVANLDAFVATVEEWEGDDRYSLEQFTELLSPFIENPDDGPDRPLVDDDVDIVFKTVHQMKGDQEEVIVLADPARSIGLYKRTTDRLITTTNRIGLAPPWNGAIERVDVPGFDNGLYNPFADSGDDIGLRWTLERWRPSTDGSDGPDSLAGPELFQRACAERRAESWRLLFVAMSRAQSHLVVPLPSTWHPEYWNLRDHWAGVLHDAFDVGHGAPGGTHTVADEHDAEEASFAVAVNDVGWVESTTIGSDPVETPRLPPLESTSESWLPRFVRPSTVHPLSDDPERYALDHLMGQALHTDSASPEIDLPYHALGPDQIGQLTHDLVRRIATRNVTTKELETVSGPVALILEDCLDTYAAHLSDGDRAVVHSFLAETVIPQFATSALRERVDRAEAVYGETKLEGVITVDGVKIEVRGQGDIVCRHPDGSWTVDDVKVALAAITDAPRYQVQLATYEWVLQQQLGEDVTVRSYLTYFGVGDTTVEQKTAATSLKFCLEKLL
ncbi:UvrD-helicase domain-containing protein [Natrialba sp. SSL1]|uniref:UvrD-helicase domain-containing protein n=1 Tax=Natrialba sp. SSL1 TaxID=1869245 RepID=UPI0008F905F3|nr:UvrD-helicase domain-containing protein [Natrialba sp. SSL1]OIB56151.1 hypothetical protein BBD46_19280 [Natrialba sp. SSL1]